MGCVELDYLRLLSHLKLEGFRSSKAIKVNKRDKSFPTSFAATLFTGESAIARIVAISGDGKLLPPCVRWLALMVETNESKLMSMDVILDDCNTIKLIELFLHPYHDVWN